MRTVFLRNAPLAMLAGVPMVLAQQAPVPASGGAQQGAAPVGLIEVEEVIVTSSRAALPGFSASTPTTVVSGSIIAREGAQNLAQVLDNVPGFKNFQSPAANGVKTATPGTSTADLRGLGGQRTLVLVDGLRAPPTAPTTNTSVVSAVDLNTIPALMVDRVEVVTGGASAQWGSDAVAGVVNVILKTDFEGLQVKTQAGRSQRGDAESQYFGVLGGLHFGGDRGRLVVSAEYQNDDGLGDLYERDYANREAQVITNGASATNGLTPLIKSDNVHTSLGAGGTITGPANFIYRGYTFNPGGQTVRPFQQGSLVSGVQMIGGEGLSTVTGLDQIPSVQRVASYARAAFDFTDSITGTLALSYAESEGVIHGSLPRLTGRTIQQDNAFLPSDVRAAMVTAGITSFGFQKNAFDLGNSRTEVTDKVPRAIASLKGSLGSSEWTWDVNYEHGQDRYTQEVANATNNVALGFALDAVADPVTGNIVCRATLPGAAFRAAAAGCVPINLFGDGTPSAQAMAYVQNTGTSESRYKQNDASANIKGKPFETWAGPVAVAAGLEYRKESQDVTANALAASGVFLGAGNALPYNGDFNVKEGYVDTIVPLITDLAFAKALTFSGAFRYEDYSNIGNQNTWKAGFDYKPVSSVRLRATRSKDIRAPQLFELFGGGQAITNTVSVRGFTANIPINVTLGNPNLQGEDATTTTGGIVFSPSGVLQGLTTSIDYYDVKIDNAISSLSTTTIATLCTLGNQQFCNFFTFNPATGAPTALNATTLNVASIQTKGIDFELAYTNGLPEMFGQAASFAASVRGTYTLHSYVNTGGGAATIDRADENGPQNLAATPRMRLNLSQTLNLGKLSFTAQELFLSAGQLDNTFNTVPNLVINDNTVPSITYVNLFGTYDATEHLQFFLSVRNALDKEPPLSPNPNLPVPPFNGQYYDVVGRSYRLGLQYEF